MGWLNCRSISPFSLTVPGTGKSNPRSREESDLRGLSNGRSSNGFQSTLPRRERHDGSSKHESKSGFQSTLPRRERRKLVEVGLVVMYVSIHAPAKGATYASIDVGARLMVSIHAPAKGATRYYGHRFEQLDVSIHAPAKGATRCLSQFNMS